MSHSTLDFKTVCQCNQCLGSKTLHPQASLINLERPDLEQDAVKFEFYAILLIEECPDCDCCGRKYYDYSNATMVFLAPGEIFRLSKSGALPPKGWILAFHPDLLFHTSLKNHMESYTFFHYNKDEALHLSKRETATVTCCVENIEEELHHDIDSHTNTILSRHIELLLDYCTRFYERQFITRDCRNKDLIRKFDRLASDFISSGELRNGFPPQADHFAKELNLSEAYFNDLLKFETGKTLEEEMQFRRLEAARHLLTETSQSPTHISLWLGFSSVQYFSTLFKRLTGLSPIDYRNSMN